MAKFIGRPNLPSGLAQELVQMAQRQVDPLSVGLDKIANVLLEQKKNEYRTAAAESAARMKLQAEREKYQMREEAERQKRAGEFKAQGGRIAKKGTPEAEGISKLPRAYETEEGYFPKDMVVAPGVNKVLMTPERIKKSGIDMDPGTELPAATYVNLLAAKAGRRDQRIRNLAASMTKAYAANAGVNVNDTDQYMDLYLGFYDAIEGREKGIKPQKKGFNEDTFMQMLMKGL